MGRRQGLVAVCADPDVAAALIERGAQVVFCSSDASQAADTLITLRALASGGGAAALIGDLADPEVEAAARAMAAELFGGDPIVVRSRSDAGQEMTPPPGSDEGGSGTV